ncbi:hypothetical protein EXIGLDRAFT_836136 [Exidia glandulosa HHB12029]|uniref:TPR-like protein n=1 Tax=Exidia glandulosa HHB12029 TaxID=1314781 RepID=A0A165I4C8_EXIGL|nr:hypothetical protein EXIGLDRAFT_836136 [Exidia glandulosa HHB12029]
MSADLQNASEGFDLLFINDLNGAQKRFAESQSPFHLTGAGVCAFLQAALGMETELLAEAARCLGAADTGAKAQGQAAKSQAATSRFGAGVEWEVLRADAAVMTGLTQAIGETYMGYLNCLYSLNNAHSRFSKLYKSVFPSGMDSQFATPATSKAPSRNASTLDLSSSSPTSSQAKSTRSGLFGRWGLSAQSAPAPAQAIDPQMEEFIIAGTAFGYGLFNLVFALLPARVKSVVGFFGFTGDLQTALHALAVAAARDDIHAIFARLTLMNFNGAVLTLSGWQTDEAHLTKQYTAMVDACLTKYPSGTLWIGHKAKLLRLSGKFEEAAAMLQVGLQHDPQRSFVQADVMLMYDLAWALLALRKYNEAAEAFVKLKDLNKWSPSTYNFLAAGCYLSAGNRDTAKALLDAIPSLLESKKGQRELPMEKFIGKKLALYKTKHERQGNASDRDYIDEIAINPAHELGLFLNVHSHMTSEMSKALIQEWLALTPRSSIVSPVEASAEKTPLHKESANDLILPEELALRSLLLGVVHGVASYWTEARAYLEEAAQVAKEADYKWVCVVAHFELATLELRETSARLGAENRQRQPWMDAIAKTEKRIETALSFSTNTTEMTGRMESRINMLRHEMTAKKRTLE